MRSLMQLTFISLVAGAIALSVATPAEAKSGHKRDKHDRVAEERVVHVGFAPYDVRVIREYYAPRYRRLPPGLQKKYMRTGQLPPGWQRRFEPLPLVVERRLVVLPHGYRRGIIEGHAIIFNPGTHVIVDVATLLERVNR
jgi:hypothetical protein